MGHAPPAYWQLNDLAATGDLAAEFGVRSSTIVNWTTRYDDFPQALIELSTGPVYSRHQVRQWHDSREWKADREHQRRT